MSAVQSYDSLGREVELYNRVKSNDPTNAAFVLLVLTDAADLVDLPGYATVAALLADFDEVTNAGYARITLDDSDIDALPAADAAGRLLTLPLVTFGSPNIDAGDNFGICVVAYDGDTTGGTDANVLPVTYHEMRINGTSVPGTGTAGIAFDLSNGWVIAK